MDLFGETSSHDMAKTKAIYNRSFSPENDQNFQYTTLKHPKVYSQRDFPLHCGPSAIQSKRKCTEDGPSVKSSNQSKLPRRVNFENRVLVGASGHIREETRLVTPDAINDAARAKVKDALKLFKKLYNEISDEFKGNRKAEYKGGPKICREVAEKMRKMGKWVSYEKKIGPIEGINVGDRFRYRAELVVVGLNCQYLCGIDYLSKNGKIYAISIVDSGHYDNKAKSENILIYSGQGGNPLLGSSKVDQELKRGNLALKNSKEMGYPVRVISKSKKSNSLHMNGTGVLVYSYEYDGLYLVKKVWQERDHDDRLLFKFELHKIQGQPTTISSRFARKSMKSERCLVEDVSQGKEKMSIRVMNGIDSEKPRKFTYITETIYPNWFMKTELAGCTCTNGCSSMEQCLCVLKNGDEIAYECGPLCNCPPLCKNRVTQQGPGYKLEIYKTKFGRWAVRSRDCISSGRFVCECVGMLVPSKKDQHGGGEYEVGFIMDTVESGNVGRFIGHDDSPNLFARYILYDHDDKRMAHIMLFAAKGIPPKKELTCDHNLVRVKFANN